MADQANKLRHGDAQCPGSPRDVPCSSFNDIHCLGEERRVVSVFRADPHPLALPPLFPEIATDVTVGVDPASNSPGELQSEPPPCNAAILLLAPTFGGHDFNATGNVPQVHSRISSISMLSTGSSLATKGLLALFAKLVIV